MNNNKLFKIVCPHCGAEYTISEIYYPKELEGRTENIIKNEQGKILYLEDEELNYIQHFNCDYCNKDFVVKANITFNTFNSQESLEEVEKSNNESLIKEGSIFE